MSVVVYMWIHVYKCIFMYIYMYKTIFVIFFSWISALIVPFHPMWSYTWNSSAKSHQWFHSTQCLLTWFFVWYFYHLSAFFTFLLDLLMTNYVSNVWVWYVLFGVCVCEYVKVHVWVCMDIFLNICISTYFFVCLSFSLFIICYGIYVLN